MRKILVGIVLALLCGNVIAADATKDCHVGADPWRPGRQVGPNEKEYRLSEPLIVVSLNSKGKPSGQCRLNPDESTIVIPNGFDTSVDHTGLLPIQLAWIKGCGNPIVSKFRLTINPVPAQPVQTAAPVAPPPPVVSIDGKECRYGERMGTYRFMDGQMVCLIQEVVRMQAEPEEYEEEYEYVEAPRRKDTSWWPWVIGGTVLSALWWDTHRDRSSSPSGRAPSGYTGPVVGGPPVGVTDPPVGGPPKGFTGW